MDCWPWAHGRGSLGWRGWEDRGEAALHKDGGHQQDCLPAVSWYTARLVGMIKATCKVLLLQEQATNTLRKGTARILPSCAGVHRGRAGPHPLLGEKREAEAGFPKPENQMVGDEAPGHGVQQE